MNSGFRGVVHAPEDAPHVTLYRTKGCHLCDVGLAVMLSLQRVAPYHLHVTEIDGDPEFERRFLLEVPVVEVDGEVVCSGGVDVNVLRAAVNRARIASTRRSATGGDSPS